MGEAFDEFNLKPKGDLEKAIQSATKECMKLEEGRLSLSSGLSISGREYNDRFCWRMILEVKKYHSKPGYWNHGIYYHYK